jgi:carboxymethylenebutenolidase
MRAAGNSPEVHRYEGNHAFFNERRADVYDADAPSLAWERMVAFLNKHLA